MVNQLNALSAGQYWQTVVEDEPEKEQETALTVNLSVKDDFEPVWRLVSDRATAQGVTRSLSWADRLRLAPTVIGTMADHNLGWRRGSVLNRLTDEKADASAALVAAARHARTNFDNEAEPQLAATLAIVKSVASDLSIGVGSKVQALLDAHSVTFGGGNLTPADSTWDGVKPSSSIANASIDRPSRSAA